MRSDQRKEIQELVEILGRENLTEIEIERKDVRIRIRRESLPSFVVPPPAPKGQREIEKETEISVEPVTLESSRF